MRVAVCFVVFAIALGASAATAIAAPSPRVTPDGKALWRTRVGEEAGPTWLAAEPGVVAAVSWEGALVALEPATGAKRWSLPGRGDSSVSRLAALRAGVVVTAWNDRDVLSALDARTGKLRWERNCGAAITSLVGAPGHRLVVVTHRALGPEGPRQVAHAVDAATGETVWMVPAEGVLQAADGHRVYLATFKPGGEAGEVIALTIARGEASALSFGGAPVQRIWHVDGERIAVEMRSPGAAKTCVANLAGDSLRCVLAETYAPAGYLFSGATLRGDTLFFGLSHIEAHNLDPTPDSWLFAVDLHTGELIRQSRPLVASIAPVAIGNLILTGFGTTGAKDVAYALDTSSLEPRAALALRKAPLTAATDGARAYWAAYDGAVVAWKLPEPAAVNPDAAVPVTPVPGAYALLAEGARGSDLVREETVLQVVPKRATTAGQNTEGTVTALAFVDSRGELLAVGSNDDVVRIVEVKTGKVVWKSPRQRADVQDIAVCPESPRLAVVDGDNRVFGYDGPGWGALSPKAVADFAVDGWQVGFTSGCRSLGSTGIASKNPLYGFPSGVHVLDVVSPLRIDGRGFGWSPAGLAMFDETAQTALLYSVSPEGDRLILDQEVVLPNLENDAGWTQLRRLDRDTALAEQCSETQCLVHLVAAPENQATTRRFDITGGVWFTDIPSTIAVALPRRLMFWHRDGLEALVVDTRSDRQQMLGAIERSMAGSPRVAVSADGSRLAIGHLPHPHAVTVFRVVASD